MRFVRIAFRLKCNQFDKLIQLGNTVVDRIDGSSYFILPTPSTGTLRAAIADTVLKKAAWGDVGHRGSHEDYVNLCQSAQTLFELLQAMAKYVSNTAIQLAGSDYTALGVILTSSGFDLSMAPARHAALGHVQDFCEKMENNLNRNQVKLKWKRPLGTTA